MNAKIGIFSKFPISLTSVFRPAMLERVSIDRERVYGLQRPFNIYTLEMDKSKGWKQGITGFFVPIEQGRTRFITSLASSKLSKLPLPNWILHLLTLK